MFGIHIVARGAPAAAYRDAIAAANSVEALAAPGIGGAGGFSPAASGSPGRDGSAEAVRRAAE